MAARAPTTPPDMGASTKRPCFVQCTALATSRDEVGSIVEQSMKSRSGLTGARAGSRILWKTFLTWDESGRTVMMVSYLVRLMLAIVQDQGERLELLINAGNGFRGLAVL